MTVLPNHTWSERRRAITRFAFAFLGVFFAFGVANVISYYVRTDMPGANDAIRRAGFPFLVWEEGGFAYRYHFSHAALWANIAVAVCLSAVVGVLVRRITGHRSGVNAARRAAK